MQRNIFYAGWGWGAGIIMAALPEVCDSGWLPGSSYVYPYVFGGLTLLGIFVLVLTTVGFLTNQFLEHSGRVMTIPIAGMIFCGVALSCLAFCGATTAA